MDGTMRSLTLALVVGSVVSCATPPPPEFALYVDSFESLNAATAEMLAIFEPVEKAVRAPTDTSTFNPDDAPYIADEGRGGVALQIERGMAAVSGYNAILTLYAQGESVSSLEELATGLSSSVGVLATSLGLPVVGPSFAAGVEGLQVLASALLSVSDRTEFAKLVLEQSATFDGFLVSLRDLTPDMYRSAVTYVTQRKTELGLQGRTADIGALDGDLEQFRQMLASWVLAIDDARHSIGALEAAVAVQDGALDSIDAVSFWTNELNRHTEAVKFAARSISAAFTQ